MVPTLTTDWSGFDVPRHRRLQAQEDMQKERMQMPVEETRICAAWTGGLIARVAAVRPQIDRLLAAIVVEQHPDVGRVLAAADVPVTLVGVCTVLSALETAQLAPEFRAVLTQIVFQAVAVAGGYVG